VRGEQLAYRSRYHLTPTLSPTDWGRGRVKSSRGAQGVVVLIFPVVYESSLFCEIFLSNRGIYKPALPCPQARASKDPQGNVQDDTNTLRQIDGSPWRASSHSVSRKSGRWIYQRAPSFELIIRHWRHSAACPGINFKRTFHVKSF
jgi:hypothetical protein